MCAVGDSSAWDYGAEKFGTLGKFEGAETATWWVLDRDGEEGSLVSTEGIEEDETGGIELCLGQLGNGWKRRGKGNTARSEVICLLWT